MASLMYATGDSYSNYQEWATKLTNVYMENATQITNAYTTVATGQVLGG